MTIAQPDIAIKLQHWAKNAEIPLGVSKRHVRDTEKRVQGLRLVFVALGIFRCHPVFGNT